MTSVAVFHNVLLTDEERQTLAAGGSIETIGISVPVWNTGSYTTEPAEEVFCTYRLSATGRNEHTQFRRDGYVIDVPHIPNEPLDFSNRDWWELLTTKNAVLEHRFNNHPRSIDVKTLARPDGRIHYTEEGTMNLDDKEIDVFHYVSIASYDRLEDSIVETKL